MAAFEPSHLAAELAEASGVPPDLARALVRGASSSSAPASPSRRRTPPPGAAPGEPGAWPGAGLGEEGAEGGCEGGEGEGGAGWEDLDAGGGGGAQPDFLDMVPWWTGTSADLLKTCLDLIISLKLFLGRFDLRTMQVLYERLT
jgi:hypothetical protein